MFCHDVLGLRGDAAVEEILQLTVFQDEDGAYALCVHGLLWGEGALDVPQAAS